MSWGARRPSGPWRASGAPTGSIYPQCTMPVVHAVALAGSLRKESWNKKLLRLAIDAAREAGLEARELGLAEVPLYSADVEAVGFPDAVQGLRRAVREAGAPVIAEAPGHK